MEAYSGDFEGKPSQKFPSPLPRHHSPYGSLVGQRNHGPGWTTATEKVGRPTT